MIMNDALKIPRKYRLFVVVVAALATLAWYFITDPDGGAETICRLQWLAWLLVVAGPVYLMRRALMDGARSNEAYRSALQHPIGAGLVFLGLCLLTGLLFLAFASQARADAPPAKALPYLDTLQAEIADHWPDMPLRSATAAQVEQETCPSLKSSKCWNPRTELKTSREYGFGLGQLTVTGRYDNFAAARGLHPSLHDWQWQDRYDARRQLRTMLLMDRDHYRRLALIKNDQERLAMAFAGYNGGLGGVLSDRRVCAAVPGCDPDKWFGHVELHSLKAKKAAKGYGKSFFQINREYVQNIIYTRRPHYAAWFGEV